MRPNSRTRIHTPSHMMHWLSRNLWFPPAFFAAFVLVTGLAAYRAIDKQQRQNLTSDLKTILGSNRSAIETWMSDQERAASMAAAEPGVREAALSLIRKGAEAGTTASLEKAPEQAALRQEMAEVLEHWEFEDFVVIGNETVVASRGPASLGQRVKPAQPNLLDELARGRSVLSRPRLSPLAPNREPEPVMWVASPVRNDEREVQGILAFRLDPRKSFSRLLKSSRFGVSGETYAFGPDGLLLSKSRFDDQLRDIGLIDQGAESLLNVRVVDPGTDLTQPAAEPLPPAERPFTAMAESATKGRDGVNVDGYRDFRGVEVIGAWTWVPGYDFGLATEVDKNEAYETTALVRHAVWGLFGTSLLAALAIAIATRLIAKLRKTAEQAEHLGQYVLEGKIGEGGMGAVYRAKHALLRRPTAVKVLRSDGLDAASRGRFEREVQVTALLTHPNTIAIYDYGHTADGVFYYAMEYLEGITLEQLVRTNGAQPQSRVVHILAQICGSLAEAHAAGLVHRDIKPANVILCERGGLFDVVKVVDFGLVKHMSPSPDSAALTHADAITGTPLYMAPEAITDPNHVDARVDLYAVGALGYFLLTGRVVFAGESMMAILSKHVNEPPPRPSEHSVEAIHPELERLLLSCLQKDPKARPSNAAVFLAELQALEESAPELAWTQSQAGRWWQRHGDEVSRSPEAPVSTAPTLAVDMREREAEAEVDKSGPAVIRHRRSVGFTKTYPHPGSRG